MYTLDFLHGIYLNEVERRDNVSFMIVIRVNKQVKTKTSPLILC